MLRLMEKIKENGVEMSFGPRNLSVGDTISVTFRKWSDRNKLPYNTRQILSLDELRKLNIGIEDLLIDMVDKFMNEFKEKEAKTDASKRPN